MQKAYSDDESIKLLEREIRRVQRLVTDPALRARLVNDLMEQISKIKYRRSRATSVVPAEPEQEKPITFEEKMTRLKRESEGA